MSLPLQKLKDKVQSKVQAPLEDAKAYMIEKRVVLAKALAGEFLATFIFLFTVEATGVNLTRLQSASAMIVAGVSTAFVAVAVIYSFADVSGAHFNPAVTFGTCVMGKTSWRKGAGYLFSQLLGSVFATWFVRLIYPNETDVYNLLVVDVHTGANVWDSVGTEFILTFILVYVIFAVAFDTVDTTNTVKVSTAVENGGANAGENDAIMLEEAGQALTQPNNGDALKDRSVGRNLTIYTTNGNTKAGFAPIAIGFTLGFLCFIGGSTSGGAFNPARVFGPAVLSGHFNNHWVYWLGDFAGAASAGLLQSLFAHKVKVSSDSVV